MIDFVLFVYYNGDKIEKEKVRSLGYVLSNWNYRNGATDDGGVWSPYTPS